MRRSSGCVEEVVVDCSQQFVAGVVQIELRRLSEKAELWGGCGSLQGQLASFTTNGCES